MWEMMLRMRASKERLMWRITVSVRSEGELEGGAMEVGGFDVWQSNLPKRKRY